MCHLRQKLRILFSFRKFMSRSQNIQVYVYLTIGWFNKSLTSWWDKVYFWIYLLNHGSMSHQTLPTDGYKQGQYFSGVFWTIWWARAKFQVLFNLATCSNYTITSYVKSPVFHFFEKVNKGRLKMVNVNYWKWSDLPTLSS